MWLFFSQNEIYDPVFQVKEIDSLKQQSSNENKEKITELESAIEVLASEIQVRYDTIDELRAELETLGNDAGN